MAAAGQGLAGAVGSGAALWAGGPHCVDCRCRRVPREVLLTSHTSEHLPRSTVPRPSHQGAALCGSPAGYLLGVICCFPPPSVLPVACCWARSRTPGAGHPAGS